MLFKLRDKKEPGILRENISFSGLQWLFWSSLGVVFGYLVLYMKEAGYADLRIGVVVTTSAIAGIISQPLIGYLCDRTGKIRQIITLCFVLAAPSALLMYFCTSRFPLFLLFTFTLAFALRAMPPAIDMWTMKLRETEVPEINYGITRAFGSLGFAITVTVVGYIIDRFSIGIVFFVHGAIGIIAIAVVRTIKNPRRDIALEKEVSQSEIDASTDEPRGSAGGPSCSQRPSGSTAQPKLNPIILFKNVEFAVLLLVTLVIFTVFSSTMTYLPILITELGGTAKTLGFSLAVMAISEVPMLVLSTRLLSRYKDTNLMLIAFSFFVLRTFLYYLINVPGNIIYVQVVQLASFALFLPASLHYAYRIAPGVLKVTSGALVSIFSFGLGSVFGSMFGAIIIDKIDVFAIYKLGTIITLSATVFYFFFLKVIRKIL